jgi:acyl carrier protein
VRQPNASLDWDQAPLLAALEKSLPDYMIPSTIVELQALPRTRNGKLDRRALPGPTHAAEKSKGDFVAPKTPLEEKVAAIWRQLLNLERVSSTDNFFDLGGHSLLGLRLVNQLREMLGEKVPFTIIFEAPTVAEMAKALEKNQKRSAPASAPLVRVDRESRRTRRS